MDEADRARGPGIRVPAALAASLGDLFGDAGRAWSAALPALAARRMAAWELRPDGPAAHGLVALVLPVRRTDGTAAVLKLQRVDEETRQEPTALRAWAGAGAVRLLDHEPASGAMLLERLDARRSLLTVVDGTAALETLAGLLARLCAAPAPEGLRTLADLAAGMLRRTPPALAALADPADRRLLASCAAAVRELLGEPGDRLLHWDLHYGNVLAVPEEGPAPEAPARPTRWLSIDPKPLAGDPGFELLPALHNRWEEVVASGDVPRAVRRRFDLLTEVLGLDRDRAAGWTLGRVLQNALWDVGEGAPALRPAQRAIAHALLE